VGRECQRLMHAAAESEEPVSAALGAHPGAGGGLRSSAFLLRRRGRAGGPAGTGWHRRAGWPLEAAAQGRQVVQNRSVWLGWYLLLAR